MFGVNTRPTIKVVQERAALARLPNAQLHMRLLETDFPDYRQVLPTSWKRRVIVERDAFGEAMRRASVFAVDLSHSVRFSFQQGSIVLTASKLDSGTSREEFRTAAIKCRWRLRPVWAWGAMRATPTCSSPMAVFLTA